jgi:hypothetical protein
MKDRTMKNLAVATLLLGAALAGCNSASGETGEASPVDQAAALEKQAEIQEAVGDKAGAAKMREQAAALRAGGTTPAG